MPLKIGESRYGFRLIEEKEIPEIGGRGFYFIHEKTKVTLLALKNEDPHKVFSVTFKTLPEDNKGAAHIVEHTVCCASKKYPLKETFMALGQGSICTTMNACTYPDRTMYYAASPNEKDLLGVMGVYLDLVFHPAIETNGSYFLQEGWHYELEAEDEPLQVSGVVYHEMLGEYGEAGAYLQYYELETMFKDTCYQYDAGGLPEHIMSLSEKEFLAFYHKYYTGSNAVITLYGDFEMDLFLKKLDEEYLTDIRPGGKTAEIPVQKAFANPHYTMAYYPTSMSSAPTVASLCFAAGGCIDAEERLAFEILEHMLLRSTASPLLKALVMEKHLGMSLSDGGYDSCRMQPVFSITLKGTTKEKAVQFEEETLRVLSSLVKEGIDAELIDAAIETLEFELLENDDSYEPAGIVYSEMMLTSLYGGGDVFDHICYRKALEKIKALCHLGYFERVIEKAFLNNDHRTLTIVEPSMDLQCKREESLEKYLADQKAAMSSQEIGELMQLNEELERQQLRENSEEELQKLPHLDLSDLPETLEKLSLQETELLGCPLQIHEEETKQIAYFHFLWQADSVPYEKWQTLGLLAHIFTYVGTEKRSFSEIENAVNTFTGSMSAAIHAYQEENSLRTLPVFKVSCKVLNRHLEKFKELMTELFTMTQFREKDKLKELIGHIVYEIERSFTGAPEYRATQRVYAYLSPEGRYEDEVSGYAFYHYVKEIYTNFDTSYPIVSAQLQEVLGLLINRNELKLSITMSKEHRAEVLKVTEELLESLPHWERSKRYSVDEWFRKHPIEINEGFANGQDGQAITQGICYKEKGFRYKGQLEVVCNVLENTYLWDRVRLQGGAYGCDIMLTKEGYLSVCSYCDPNLSETLKIFASIGDYLSQADLSKKVIDNAIISTLGAMLVPSSMEQKSERACMYFITGASQQLRQQIYDEIRQTTLNDFHEAAALFKQLGEAGRLCIFGSREKLMQEKSRLSLIELKI